MQQIIEGIRYNTDNATLIADDHYWDGQNMDRHGRNRYLYRSPKGRYFLHLTTRWQGEEDHITPLTPDDAKTHYEQLGSTHLTYEQALGEPPDEA